MGSCKASLTALELGLIKTEEVMATQNGSQTQPTILGGNFGGHLPHVSSGLCSTHPGSQGSFPQQQAAQPL